MPYDHVSTSDPTLRQVQDNIRRAFDKVNQPRTIANIKLSTTPTKVPHGLGREIVGYQVIRKNADATVFEVASDDKTLTLQASGAVTVTLQVW